MGVELFRADRRTGMTTLVVAFRNSERSQNTQVYRFKKKKYSSPTHIVRSVFICRLKQLCVLDWKAQKALYERPARETQVKYPKLLNVAEQLSIRSGCINTHCTWKSNRTLLMASKTSWYTIQELCISLISATFSWNITIRQQLNTIQNNSCLSAVEGKQLPHNTSMWYKKVHEFIATKLSHTNWSSPAILANSSTFAKTQFRTNKHQPCQP
jgi:hypothetical protein